MLVHLCVIGHVIIAERALSLSQPAHCCSQPLYTMQWRTQKSKIGFRAEKFLGVTPNSGLHAPWPSQRFTCYLRMRIRRKIRLACETIIHTSSAARQLRGYARCLLRARNRYRSAPPPSRLKGDFRATRKQRGYAPASMRTHLLSVGL